MYAARRHNIPSYRRDSAILSTYLYLVDRCRTGANVDQEAMYG